MWRPTFRKRPGKIQQAVGSKLSAALGSLQSRCAASLNRRTAHLSPGRFKLYLLLFCIVFGSTNLVILQYALSGKPAFEGAIPKAQIRPTVLPRRQEVTPAMSVRDEHNVRTARLLMDSLARTPGGKASVDSFLLAHPGFLDSLSQAEKLIR